MIRNGEILQGTYLIKEKIGQGGAGEVYLAEHMNLRKQVVVKKIKDNAAALMHNLRAEVDILKRLHHNNLPQVYDFISVGNSAYTVIEYIEGHDLQWYIDRHYQFPEELIQKWMNQMVDVLVYLHGQNPRILHSDIKPANIMVMPNYDICLIDFNISIDGDNSNIQGMSIGYASPEQIKKADDIRYGRESHEKIDEQMDIYSTGAVFYMLMTGFNRTSLIDQIHDPLPDIRDYNIPYSEPLKEVVRKAVQYNPSKRYKSAKQMQEVLNDIGKSLPSYHLLTSFQIGFIFIYIICMALSITLVVNGNISLSKEKYLNADQELSNLFNNSEYSQAINKGLDILNDDSLSGYLKSKKEDKATILHTIAESYYNESDYINASIYYQQAYELVPGNESYYSDYLISLIQANEISKAQTLISQNNLEKSANTKLIEANFSFKENDYDNALEKGLDVINSTDASEDTIIKACSLVAQIYEEEGNYEKAIEVLKNAVGNNLTLLRQAGQLAFEAGNQSKKSTYYKEAVEIYQKICQRSSSISDLLNLAISQRALGNYSDSNQTLTKLEQSDSGDYRVYMWKAYNDYSLTKSGQDKSDDFKSDYKNAERYYSSSKNDSQMEELIELADRLGL